MPIREGKAKLWFNTKEEQDEFDDKMIAAVTVQSDDSESEYFTPVFNRAKQEFFLELSDDARSEFERHSVKDISEYVDKYYAGKRDHTNYRSWTVDKFGVGVVGSYLLLRELPIRNFYARAWIMFAFASKVAETWWKGLYVWKDEYVDKEVRNYGVYQTLNQRTPPTLDGKLPEEALWKLNQPGYLRDTPVFVDNIVSMYFAQKKVVDWDGSFNMPLEGLAHPKAKDSKFVDFIYE